MFKIALFPGVISQQTRNNLSTFISNNIFSICSAVGLLAGDLSQELQIKLEMLSGVPSGMVGLRKMKTNKPERRP